MSSTATARIPQQGKNPIPGLSMLGYGYNVFASPYCSDSACTELLLDGLAIEEDQTQDVDIPGWSGTFRCPTMIKLLYEQQGDFDYDISAETVEEYTSKLTVSANLSGSYGAFSGSIKSTYSQSTSTYLDNIYGEHGHTFKGPELRLPQLASQLRARLKPAVKEALLHRDPDEIRQLYGTHLVAGLIIGAKTRLVQYSTRSEVANATEFTTAVEAKYNSITAGASIDSQTSQTIKKFHMDSEVRTLGGQTMIIRSVADFQQWLKTVHDIPAIIEMTTLVPLWQLLDPRTDSIRRDHLKDAILRYAKRFQPGVLYGTSELHNNYDSSNTWVDGQKQGEMVGKQADCVEALSWSSEYKQGNSIMYLWQGTGVEAAQDQPPQGMAIYGGEQLQSSYDSSATPKQIYSWGVASQASGTPLQEWTVFDGFTNCSAGYGDMGMSWIKLYIGPVEDAPGDAWIVVGGRRLWDDGTHSYWGLSPTGTGIKDQQIGTVLSWKPGGFQKATVYFHLKTVQQNLSEINEG